MIAWLSGTMLRRTGDAVVVDVGGVGYEVAVPLSTLQRLPEAGDEVRLHVYTHLREDSLSLFGFATEQEKELFVLLLGVSGVGPRLALSVLSNLSVESLLASLRRSDEAALCRIPGIGKKTAARLCLELKDRIARLVPGGDEAGARHPPAPGGPGDDAVSALINLGYRQQPAEEAVRTVLRSNPAARLEELIRDSLNLLHGR